VGSKKKESFTPFVRGEKPPRGSVTEVERKEKVDEPMGGLEMRRHSRKRVVIWTKGEGIKLEVFKIGAFGKVKLEGEIRARRVFGARGRDEIVGSVEMWKMLGSQHFGLKRSVHY